MRDRQMSLFGDLVSGANCGTANPISAALNSQMSMGAQLADVKGMTKPMAGAPPPQQMHPGMKPPGGMAIPPMVNAFQQQFEHGPKPHFMGPAPPQLQRPPSQAAPPLLHHQSSGAKGGDANAMIAEFARMEMQQKQQAQFEDAYRAGQQQQQPQQPPMMQRPLSNPQQMMPPPQQMGAAWIDNFRQQQMRLANQPNPDFNQMYQQIVRGPQHWGDEFHHMQQQLAQAGVKPPPPQAEAAAPQVAAGAASAQQQQDFNAAFAEAQAPTNAFIDEFVAQQEAANTPNTTAAPPANGSGMGMDPDMLNKLRNSDDPKWRNSKFIKFLDQIQKGEIEFKDNQAVPKAAGAGAAPAEQATVKPADGAQAAWAESFDTANAADAAAEALRGAVAPAPARSWSDAFVDQAAAANGDWASQFGAAQQAAQAANPAAAQEWARQFAEAEGDLTEPEDYTNINWQQALQQAKDAVPQAKDPEYKFALNNPYANSKDPMDEGMKLWKAGKLKEAILAFEVEVTRHADNADAWRCIGEAQAENEDEHGAIAGLLKCISIDPYNLKALMMLGVSYTNDLEETRALKYLQTWMLNHPDYQGTILAGGGSAAAQTGAAAAAATEVFGGTASRLSLHDEVTKMFLDAMRVNPRDADLHTVLGVLFHISNDFDKAIDAFKTAVKLRPDDPCLWNKLGATQANSNRSGDAVHAYKRALELRPGYVRALANLAISFANQGRHAEAAQTYLATLKHNPDASHVWSYLRISLGHMGKDNLVDLTQRKDVELFRQFFNF